MTKVYIIRHAEAEGNLYRRIHGWYNSGLTDLGRRQLEAIADRFMDIKLDVVYSSDLKRARQTAEAVARGSGVDVTETKQLREVNLGVWEDRTWGEAASESPEQITFFNRDPEKWNVEGSEPLSVTQERMMSVLSEITARHAGGRIAIVSHGAAIRALLAAILGIPSENITKIHHCDNTAVTELTVEGGKITVDSMGDCSHLKTVGTRFLRQDWWKNERGIDTTSLRFEPLDLKTDEKAYRDIHPNGDWNTAVRRVHENSEAVAWAMCEDERVGLIELDIKRESEKNVGWIEHYAMLPRWRGKYLSVQLLGHAVSVYRRLGREMLRLEAYGAAAEYFGHYGFTETSTDGILEKDISI